MRRKNKNKRSKIRETYDLYKEIVQLMRQRNNSYLKEDFELLKNIYVNYCLFNSKNVYKHVKVAFQVRHGEIFYEDFINQYNKIKQKETEMKNKKD